MHKVFDDQVDEQRWASGPLVQLCVIEEMQPLTKAHSSEAIAVIGGISVCRKHLDLSIKSLKDGHSMTQIISMALAGEFN